MCYCSGQMPNGTARREIPRAERHAFSGSPAAESRAYTSVEQTLLPLCEAKGRGLGAESAFLVVAIMWWTKSHGNIGKSGASLAFWGSICTSSPLSSSSSATAATSGTLHSHYRPDTALHTWQGVKYKGTCIIQSDVDVGNFFYHHGQRGRRGSGSPGTACGVIR